MAGIPLDLRDPRLATVMVGITRAYGTRLRRQAAPAVPDVLRVVMSLAPDGTHLRPGETIVFLLTS